MYWLFARTSASLFRYDAAGILIRSYYVDYNDIFVMEVDLSTYAATGTIAYNYSWDGEGALNRAINYVTSNNQIKIFQLMGHGEPKLSDSFLDAVADQNYEYSELSLLIEDHIPNECDLLLINAPQVDINMSERAQIISYLQNGGRLLLISDTGICDLPNLRYVMAQYGAEPMQGNIIEGDSSHSLYGYAHYLLPEFGNHSIVQPLKDGRYLTLLPASHGILLVTPRDSVKIDPLLTTSIDSYLKVDGFQMTTYDRQETDIDGPFNIGIAIEQSNDITETATRIVWVASPYLVDDSVNTMVSGTNQDVFLNSIAWLCNEENHITIHVKSMDVEYLIVPDASAKAWSIVLVGVVPSIFFIICAVVWFKRRWK